MLDIYPVILSTISDLKPALRRIERCDRDLGRQMRRAATSIALNVAEGMYSRGKNREARYHTALGSARETMACLEVATALGYIRQPNAESMKALNRIVGTLVRLADRSG
jgi:four helix bundle protein